MELLTTTVPRALDAKMRLFGFELPDLLMTLIYMSVSNLFLGSTFLRIPIVWGGTVVIASIFLVIKRGKPDNFLQHSFEYLNQSTVYSSASADLQCPAFRISSSQNQFVSAGKHVI